MAARWRGRAHVQCRCGAGSAGGALAGALAGPGGAQRGRVPDGRRRARGPAGGPGHHAEARRWYLAGAGSL